MWSDLKIMNSFLRLIIGLVLCVAMNDSSAQLLTDDFQDGDFSSAPEWIGDTGNFTVNSEAQLQLNHDQEGSSFISTSVSETLMGDTEWRFYIRQSFSPSDNNKSRVYLMSTAASLAINGNGANSGAESDGYFLQFGEGGSNDAIELFRNDQGAGDGFIESVARGTEGFISSSFEITVKIVRTSTGDWEIWADQNAGEEFTLQATGSDALYTGLDHFGWVCRYTASNADNFYLDNVYIGDPVVDQEPPELTNLTVNSANQLTLEFNEPLDLNSAENTINYSVSGGIGNSTSATLSGGNTVVLQFSTAFPDGEELTLTVTAVEDQSENAVVSAEDNFTYIEVAEPQPGDIIINEIFADPSPPIGLPEEEWIELYNSSENAFDLAELEYYNTTTLNPLESYVLPAGGYVIISSQGGATALDSFSETAAASSFSALSNGGDSLTITFNGTIIDVVVYEDDWYQDATKEDGGWSLERINPEAICSGAQNWIASNGALGATPGAENSVYSIIPDTEVPQVLSAGLANEMLVFLQASEILNADLDLANFTISGSNSITGVELTAALDGLLLSLENPVEIGVPFTITVTNLTDCEGNINSASSEWEIASGFPAEPGDVIITEIMVDPSPQVGLPEVEYVELHNTTALFIDISDADFSGASFATPVILAPEEYKVIMNQDDIAGNFIFSNAAGMQGWSSTFLTNSGKDLILSTENGIIDQVEYDNTWYADEDKDDGGWSLELINPTHPCSDEGNWRASVSVFGGSPGEENSVYSTAADTEAPEITLAYSFLANAIFIEFSEPIDESSLTTANIDLSGEPFVSATAQDLRSIIVNFSNGLSADEEFILTVNGVTDCWGNAIENATQIIGLPAEAEVGDLIINEVLSNPRGSGSDYVEIYNNSDKIISLQNWQIAQRDEGELDDLTIIAEVPRPIFPGGFALLTESIENTLENYPFGVTENFITVDLPSYSNDEGDVVLVMPNNEVSDEFNYSSDYHFGLIDDTDGVSLERIYYSVDTNDPENWNSASETDNFGTPGYRNSQTLDISSSTGEVSVFPPAFSPDNDGYQDNLSINYELAQNANVVSLDIYNKEGLRVRRLKQNFFTGSSGSFLWDGLSDAGEKLPIGIYVIYLEVFTVDGSVVNGYKVPAVIAHQ